MNGNDNQRPFRIGLTGGIASGKSTVADMFKSFGVPVIDTDIIAREVVEPGQPALSEIVARFGENIVDSDGHLDRKALRKIIFADETARTDLEAILHPRIGTETRRQSQEANGPYQLIVVPLLADSALLEFVDRVLVVDCSEETQIGRLLDRDAETAEQARRILASQASRHDRLAIADDVIVNNQSVKDTARQVELLHAKYQQLVTQRVS